MSHLFNVIDFFPQLSNMQLNISAAFGGIHITTNTHSPDYFGDRLFSFPLTHLLQFMTEKNMNTSDKMYPASAATGKLMLLERDLERL